MACPDCELRQRVEAPPDGGCRIACARCHKVLDRGTSPHLTISLACFAGALALLVGLLAVPLVHAALYGLTREVTIWDGARALAQGGWPLLAALTALLAVAVPLTRAALVVAVLATLRRGRRGAWLGRLYRHAHALRSWSVPEVFALGYAITLTRASDSLTLLYDAGSWMLIALVLLLVVGNATLEDSAVWDAIAPPPRRAAPQPTAVCRVCALEHAIGEARCPRCGSAKRAERDPAATTTIALVAASWVLLIPAYALTVGIRVTPLGNDEFTIMGGAREMADTGYWPLAVIIVVASIGVPVGKLLALSWLLLTVRLGSARHLALKARLYRFVSAIGRWSFTDLFVAAVTVALLAFPGFVVAQTGPAMLPFVLVVVLTLLASHAFDPRLLWDAAEQPWRPAPAAEGVALG